LIDQDLLDILACPACKTSVKLDGEELLCPQCGRRYPIRDGIPIMLVEEARMPDSGGRDKAHPAPTSA
jgi:uncharacterized protein YbaR (Trm112 family)